MARWTLTLTSLALLVVVVALYVMRFGVSIGAITITGAGVRRDPSVGTLELWEQQVRTVTVFTGSSHRFFPRSAGGQEGTSFFVSPDRLLTVAHVDAGARGAARITGPPGEHIEYLADVTHIDTAHDLALMQPEQAGGNAPVMRFRTDNPANGEHAWALCAAPARDIIPVTVTGRSANLSEVQDDGSVRALAGVGILFKGAVHPGCSGAPMVDTNGEVIGVVFGSSGDQGAAVAGSDVIAWLEAQSVTPETAAP